MSTVWYSRRCKYLHSIEHDSDWYVRVSALLAANSVNNVKLELRSPDAVRGRCAHADFYTDLSAYAGPTFHLIVVDGGMPTHCLEAAIPKLLPSGYLYLGNSDIYTEAAVRLAHMVRERGGSLRHFTDFSPAIFQVTQGALAQF